MSNKIRTGKTSRASALIISLVAGSVVVPAPAFGARPSGPRLSLEGDPAAVQMIASGTARATAAMTADINDDGASDVIVGIEGDSGGAVLVWRGNPALVYPNHGLADSGETIESAGLVRSVPVAPRSLTVRDADGDRSLDVVVSGNGSEAVAILEANDPSLQPVDVIVPASKSADSPLVVTGRFNSDAMPDSVSIDRTTFLPSVLLSKVRATFTVTSAADSGAGTLRQAILDANGSAGPDTISFNIGSENKTIEVTSTLPAITEAVSIDATSQPLYAGVPLVELTGGMLGAASDGIVIQASTCVVRGLAISDFTGNGIVIQAAGNIIEGNHIGTNLAGTAIKANDGVGILIDSVGSILIGGVSPSAMNVISGNGAAGIAIGGVGAASNGIAGNRIGTNRDGTIALSNGTNGITLVAGANSTSIGGASAGARNVISGNANHGVFVAETVSGVVIENNAIGTQVDGTGDLGNKGNGVHMAGLNNLVQANRIATNSGDGVTLEASAIGISITQNAMAGNGGLAIDLADDGVTANDIGDADGGPNDLQNFPVLESASSVGGTTTITGSIVTEPSSSYRIEFFANDACDPSGNGEGNVYLGYVNVVTNISGIGDITAGFAASVSSTQTITATATDAAGNTSELSACISALTTADVSLSIVGAPNPVVPGGNIVYTVTVNSAGPLPAADVLFLSSTPSGTVFTSATTGQGTLTTPVAGGVGAISCAIGTIPVGQSVVISIVVQVTGPATLTVVNTGFVSTSTPETVLGNNTFTATNLVVDPPVITSISKVSGEPFRIRILGANFKPGAVVFIDADVTPWPNVKMKNSTSLTLKKGATLKSRFPKGVAVTLRVVNTDGGQTSMSYTR